MMYSLAGDATGQIILQLYKTYMSYGTDSFCAKDVFLAEAKAAVSAGSQGGSGVSAGAGRGRGRGGGGGGGGCGPVVRPGAAPAAHTAVVVRVREPPRYAGSGTLHYLFSFAALVVYCSLV